MASDHKYDVTIKFQIVRQGQGLKEVQNELDKTEKKNKKATKSMSLQWTELYSQVRLAQMALRTVARAISDVWNASRGGAELTQLTESFQRANAEIFKTPTLLTDMAAAARGTITEANLMSGIMTLVAGTSQELSSALTTNAGQLLTIAKAANRLNPVLGDTDFFYKSIATGIKRASFRILDNLGIVVRVAEANRRWASEMDRSVESMSAEERQMALLNEVLRVGGRLVDQAGGTTESLTDSYDILKTMMEEVKNASRELLDRGIRPLIQDFADAQLAALEFESALAKVFSPNKVSDVDSYRKALSEIGQDFAEFIAEMEGGKDLFDILAQSGGPFQTLGVGLQTLDEGLSQRKIDKKLALITAEIGKAILATEGHDLSTRELGVALRELGLETELSGVKIAGQTILYSEIADAIASARIEAGKAADEARDHGEAEEFREKMTRASALAIRDNADATARYESGLRLAVATLERMGISFKKTGKEELREYVVGLGLANLEVGKSLKGNAEFITQMKLLGFTVDATGIKMGDMNITWGGLNREAFKARLANDAATGSIERLAAADQLAEQMARVRKQSLDAETESVKEATHAYENFLASRAAQPGMAPETGDFFSDAVAGNLNFFNEELDTLGTHLTFVTDSTVQQQAQFENLGDEYDKVSQTISDYQNFAKGATLTDDERAEKIAEQGELLGILADRQASLGDVRTHYVETTRQATIDEKVLNTALFEAADAAGASALQMAIMGQALGVVTPEVAQSALQIALLNEKVTSLAERYVAGTISIGGINSEMDAFLARLGEAEVPITNVSEGISTIIETASNLPEDAGIVIGATLPDTEIGETQTAADTLASDEAYGIEFKSNAIALMETDITPLQAALDATDFEPYEPQINSNAIEEQRVIDAFEVRMRLLDDLTVTPTIAVQWDTSARPPDIPSPGPGGQHGLDIMVPQGFPNDTYPIWASSGERVVIDPNPGSSSSGDSPVQHIVNIDARGAAPGVERDIERAVDVAFERRGIRANSLRRTL